MTAPTNRASRRIEIVDRAALGVAVAGALDPSAAIGFYAIDAFASFLRVELASLRQDVQSTASYAVNALAIRREKSKDAADGKRVMTDLIPKAEHAIRRVSRLNADQVERSTVAKVDCAPVNLIQTAIQQAQELSATLRAVQAQREFVRLPAGGGSDQDRLAAVLIDRLARIWVRHTNRPVPGGASGPFVEFVAAAWIDLGFPEFTGSDKTPRPVVDAIGNRVVKFHRRHHRDENNQGLCPKPSPPRRALSAGNRR